MKAIQTILGHKDISTTLNVYADATEAGIKESMPALEGKMFNQKNAIRSERKIEKEEKVEEGGKYP